MTGTPEHERRLMLSFEGRTVPTHVAEFLQGHNVSGVTFFRPHNYDDPAQLRELSRSLQSLSDGVDPLLIATDQEGGQLHAVGAPATLWPGNMALGATGDPALTERVGAAIGRELRAVGVNVNYAPNADLATNPANPATGGRSFGDDPATVATHVGAFVRGIQSEGVAATMKHFPGKGDAAVDSHYSLPRIPHDLHHLEANEFAPFRAAADANVKVAMTGHFSLPALTGSDELPCTLATEANTGLLRSTMGFDGVMITDAIDMGALAQGTHQIVDMIAAINSGVDLLLLTADPDQEDRATTGLGLAVSRRLVPVDRLVEADARVAALRRWVGRFTDPDLSVVGCAEHARLNELVAERSITLVRNREGLLPLDPPRGRILVIEIQPSKLTPADTSDHEQPSLALAIRDASNAAVEGIVLPMDPGPEAREHVLDAITTAETVIFGTAAASLFASQAALVRDVLTSHGRVIVVAQRTPWDIHAFPEVGTYLCAWSVNPVSSRAVARAILGRAPITGRAPVRIGHEAAGGGIDLP